MSRKLADAKTTDDVINALWSHLGLPDTAPTEHDMALFVSPDTYPGEALARALDAPEMLHVMRNGRDTTPGAAEIAALREGARVTGWSGGATLTATGRRSLAAWWIVNGRGDGGFLDIPAIHEAWLAAQRTARPPHPLGALLRAYSREIEMDERDHQIMHDGLFAFAGKDTRAPVVLTAPLHDNDVPINAKPQQQWLIPEHQTRRPPVIPHSALVIADEAGFGKLGPGKGARVDKRLLTHSLLSVPMSARRPGGRYTMRPTLRDIAHGWIWPVPAETGRGKMTRSQWSPGRYANLLRRAMNAVTLAGVILPDGREWRPVMFRATPDFTDLDSRAIIEVALPENSIHGGPMIDTKALIAAGVVSDPAFDGWLTLATIWERAKHRNGGYPIYATRPEVLRDNAGYCVDVQGRRIIVKGRPTRAYKHGERTGGEGTESAG